MNRNSKLVILTTPEKAEAIFKQYRKKDSQQDLIFDYLRDTDLSDSHRVSIRTQSINRNLNRLLKKGGIKTEDQEKNEQVYRPSQLWEYFWR